MITTIMGSSRVDGNTQILMDIVLKGTEYHNIVLRDLNIQSVKDKRHDPEGFISQEDDYHKVVDQILTSDILFFVTPLYWYGMSGELKNFVDRFSESLRNSKYDFKEMMSKKKVYVVVVGGDNAKVKGEPLIQQFRYIFEFLEVEFVDYILGDGNVPGEILEDKEAVEHAKRINKNLLGDDHG